MLNKPKNLIKQVILAFVVAVLAVPNAAHAKALAFSLIMPMSSADIHNFIFNKNETVKNNTNIVKIIFNGNKEKVDPNIEAIAAKLNENIARAERIDAYFEKRDMPLAGYGMAFVQAADKYNLDWRLLAAIGVRESSGGKRLMNNNPFGWGSAQIKFTDFNEAIEVVSMNLGGGNPNTARYYKDADTKKKLWYYNGTVIPSYPDEVIDIMDMM